MVLQVGTWVTLYGIIALQSGYDIRRLYEPGAAWLAGVNQCNLKIYPIWHGEDLAVDEKIAGLFRECTKCLLHPKGMGKGTWFMREQIIKRSLRSSDDPDWVFAGRDNEHCLGNLPIAD